MAISRLKVQRLWSKPSTDCRPFGKGEVHTASVPTASIQVSTASADVAATSISHDTLCAYIASQSNYSQIKYEDITQIDEDDIKEMDIKWNMALLILTSQKWSASIATRWAILLGSAEHPGVKTEVEEKATNKVKKEKEGLDSKLTGFASASKDLDTLLESQRTGKNKEGLGYSTVPPPAQVYFPPKKDMSWTGLPEFADDTITDYSRPLHSIETDSPTIIKTNKVKTARNSPVRYAEMYRNTTKSPKVREIPTLRQYSRRATRIAQSKALSPAADELASLLRDNNQGEAFPTVTSLDTRHDMEVAVVSVPPVAGVSTVGVPTVSGLFPTVSVIFTTASVVTPYSRRTRGISAKDKGKEKVVESEEPKKKKLPEQIDAQVAKEIEEEIIREDQRMNEQLARDAEIARIHAEEELKMMIEGLDRSNEMIARHLQEYEQSKAELTIGEKIDLINELVKYQDHHLKILKYQAQQSKLLSKKEQREFYMSVLRSHAGCKTKHFRGMTLEEIKEKFILVWKQLEDFVPMSSIEEGKRMKRKGLKLDEGSAKRIKTSEDVSEKDLKEMMQLVPVEEVYVKALQVKHLIIDWEIHSEGKKDYWKIIRLGWHTAVYQQATKDKEKELWVELKRLFEPDFEDQLIQQYPQHEHYAIWEVIEFGDSYKAPPEETAKDKGLAGEVSSSTKKKERTVAILLKTCKKGKMIDDLDTMSLDDVYNHLKVYEPEGRERKSYKKDHRVEEPAPKAMIAIDGIGWDWSYMAEEDEASKNHALVANEEEYYVVPPPPAQVYSPPKKNLSWMGLSEFVDDTVTDYTRSTPSIDVSKSKCTKTLHKVLELGETKGIGTIKNLTARKRLYDVNKACYNCGSFDHLEFNCNHDTWVDKGKPWTRVNHPQDNIKYTSTHKSMPPRAVLLKSGTKPIASNRPFSTYRPTLNSAQSKMKSFVKTTNSNVKRPFERKLAAKNKVWVPTVRQKIPTAGLKVPTVKPTVDVDKGKKGKAVKASARWIWKPKQNSSGQGLNFNGVSVTFKKYQYIDTQGRLKHMTGNISYLSEYASFNGGYVSFGHGRGKITGKGSIKTVVTDDFSRFSWTFFLKPKDETSRIHRNFITDIENLKYLNVKIIRSDNRGEFRNKEMDEFCSRKGIKREFSNARTPQQNGVAERRNRTLIEATRTMLADAKLPVTFWAEVVNTTCYVQNRILVIKPHNKTPYELFNERSHAIGFLRPFGCHVMILNTLDHLGKFDAKGDEGYFVGYSLSSKAFRVFNKRTNKIEENLHVDFLENKSIKKGTGPDWLLDIDTLTNSMNYVPVVVAGTSSTNISGTKEDVHQAVKEKESPLRFIALLNWFYEAQMETSNEAAKKDDVVSDSNSLQKEQQEVNKDKEVPKSNGNSNPTASTKVSANDSFKLASSLTVETEVPTISTPVLTDSLPVPLVTSSVPRIISKGGSSYPEPLSLGNAMSFENMLEDFFRDTSNAVSLNEVEADLSNIQKTKNVDEQSFIATIHQKTNPDLLQYCLFSYFLSQEEPKKIVDALKDPSWKDERGIVIRNKARLVAQGHTQEGRIDYEEVFALVTRIEAIRLFLAYASYMCFIVYQMDVKSAFLYGTINEELYVMQPHGFQDPEFPHRVYKVEKAISMIGSLMYLTASRPDIMFAVCACARHQVTPKECHLHAVKRIFRYLKGNLNLGLWYPKESPFDLVAYSDSDYSGANQDRKSTTRGCQFLGRRLISWQCKKQTIVATSTTEAEYVAAASGCGQVLWIQN
uniref:Putative ribonuclease H-like domain-containing protein n=1 Tax=Tanacetum cinerariifolium TaxID=118510 RepID=A0A6L2JYQ4_TANCI|nr:putative ribonuclease H-like domain-containing protein [Tanacetum cinerariifolium]